MERLILVRHGTAEAEAASGEDFDRRLTPAGVAESAAMAERLAEMGFHPDRVLVSAAARAQDTWEAAAAAFPGIEPCVDRSLYLADSESLRIAAENAGAEASTVMVVAHNPGVQELALRLLAEGSAPAGAVRRAQRLFPTAAAAVFLIDANGRPAFDGFFLPDPVA